MTNSSATLAKDDTRSRATRQQDAHGKALSLNLEGSVYGTLAEIGAGQEVARWFLSVGAASGTVAKTISAYDKKVSNEIYGAGTRYVSKERLLAMLDHEYRLLLDRLRGVLGLYKRFFVFANTIAARNYEGTNQQHGWLGIRFQAEPGSEPSQILLHINLCDNTAQLQQQAVGVLGVNLVYAAFRQRSDIDAFLASLFDELSVARIEVDALELDGPAFTSQDMTEVSLALLGRKMAHAIIFDASCRPVEPASVLRKRPLIVMRGTFNHLELLDPALFQAASRKLHAEGIPFERDPAALVEVTIRPVRHAAVVSTAEMRECVLRLTPCGPVIATDFPETYLLSRYLRRYSIEPVRFVMGSAAVAKVLHESFYLDLPGALLEGLGKLLATNVKLYVAPMPGEAFAAASRDIRETITVKESANGLVGLDDLRPAPPACQLLDYLRAAGRIVPLERPQ